MRNGARPPAPSSNSNPAPRPRAEELRAFCREHLARYKVPKTFIFREIPKTSTGKIQKFTLRDIARSKDAID